MIITQTPYRVSLFGGVTDYPAWYHEHGGATLGMAIDRYCYVSVNHAPPGQTARYRIAYSKIEDRDRVEDIEHPGARGVLQHLDVRTPVALGYQGDLLSGSGLGASSAYVVGLLMALRALLGRKHVERVSLALEAIHVERHVINEPIGCQDQFYAALGGLTRLRFEPDGQMSAHAVHLSPERQRGIEDSLVLVYTGVMRHAHEMAAKVIDAIPDRQRQLHRLAALTVEGLAALERGTVAALGLLLHRSWLLKREIHQEIAPPIVDALYEHGLACGALGGKLLGAGGGGFLLFCVPSERRAKFDAEIGAPCVRFRGAPDGCRVLVDGHK